MYENVPRRTDETDDEFNEWNRERSQSETEKTNELSREQAKEVGERATKATELTDKLDPFWDEHPELLAEAKEFGAPLEVGEFKKQGYSFGQGDDGKSHIMAPTTEYAEWLSKPSEEKGNFEGKIRENLEERRQADRKRMLEEMFPNTVIDSTTENLLHTDITNPKFYGRVRELAYNNINKRRKAIKESPDFAESAYREAYEASLKNSTTDVTDDVLIQSALEVLNRRNLVKNGKNSGRVAEAIVESVQQEMLGNDITESLSELNEDEKAVAKKVAARACIRSGSFMPEVIMADPEKAEGVLAELGIDKRDDGVTKDAIHGYKQIKKGEGAKSNYADFFDLSNRVVEMLDNPKSELFRDSVGRLAIQDEFKRKNNLGVAEYVPDEIGRAAMDKIYEAENNFTQQLKESVEFKDYLSRKNEANLRKAKKELEEKIDQYQLYGMYFSFGEFLNTKKVRLYSNDVSNFVYKKVGEAGNIGQFFYQDAIDKELYDTSDVETEIDYAEIMRHKLLDGLSKGIIDFVGWDSRGRWRKRQINLTEIFDTNEFKENQERIGIDFADPEVAKIAFNGFINTVKTTNRELSEQANWYYENIFANNPDEFLAMVNKCKEYGGVGTKRKLKRFLDAHPEILESEDDKDKEKEKEKSDFERLGEMREVNEDYVDAYMTSLRDSAKLDGIYFVAGRQNQANGGGDGEDLGESGVQRYRSSVDDDEYGVAKILKWGEWKDYIRNNVDSKMKFYVESFGRKKDSKPYFAMQFTIGDKTYCIAESRKDNDAMYIAWGEAGEDLRAHFREVSKDESKTHENVEAINHLDKAHIDDSLDQCYAKAFFLLFGGKKTDRKKNMTWGKAQVYPVNPEFEQEQQ